MATSQGGLGARCSGVTQHHHCAYEYCCSIYLLEKLSCWTLSSQPMQCWTCTSLGCSIPAGTLLFWGAPSGSGKAAFNHGNCEHHSIKQADGFACVYKVSPCGWMKNVLMSIINAGAPHFPDQGDGWETALHRLVKLCTEVPGMVP